MANRLYDGEQEFCDSAFSTLKTIGINKCLSIDYKGHEKERSLEKALELVREKIRELINYTDKNKGQK